MGDQEIAVILKLLASQFQAEAKKSQGLLGDFMGVVRSWQVQLAATSGALLAIAKSTANYGEEALKAKQKTNSSVEAITALRHSSNLADVSFEQMTTAMGRLSRTAFEAASGTKESQRAFELLGIQVRTTEGLMRPTEELLLELAERIKQTGVTGREAAGLNAIFSRSYQDLIPWLIQGKDAIKEQMEEARRLGLVMSTQNAEAANRFNDELKKLQGSSRGLINQIGVQLIPVLTDLATALVEVSTGGAGQAFSVWLKGLSTSIVLAGSFLEGLLATIKATVATIKGLPGVAEGYNKKLDEIGAKTEERLRKIYGVGAAPPEVRTRDVHIGAPGPVVAPEEGAPGISRVNLDMIRAQVEASGALARAKEMLLDLDVRIGEQGRQALDDAVTLAQAQLQAAESSGASMEDLASRRRVVLEAQQTRELASTELTESQRLAIVTKYSAQIDEQRRLETGGFLEGWKIGLNKYINDYGNMLGLAVDLSRRTAQLMEQSFRTFFFDVFEGRIRSFKDVLMGVLDFVKQLVAQVAAQLATIGVLRLIGSAFAAPLPAGYGTPSGPGVQHGGTWMVQGPGGPDSRLQQFWASPGERVTVETPEQQRRGAVVTVNVYNQTSSQIQTQSRTGPGGDSIVDLLIKQVDQALGGGSFDRSLASNFGIRRQGGRR